MLIRRSPDSLNFKNVALFIIVAGMALLAVGAAQLLGQLMWQWHYGWPTAKIMSGLVIIALGYIVLELELIRQKQK